MSKMITGKMRKNIALIISVFLLSAVFMLRMLLRNKSQKHILCRMRIWILNGTGTYRLRLKSMCGIQ